MNMWMTGGAVWLVGCIGRAENTRRRVGQRSNQGRAVGTDWGAHHLGNARGGVFGLGGYSWSGQPLLEPLLWSHLEGEESHPPKARVE